MMARYLCKTLAGLALYFGAATLHAASLDDVLPQYQPRVITLPKAAAYLTPDGAVKVVGYNDMREMLEAMTPIFTKVHPGIRFEWDLKGTRFAPAALAAGVSAFAPMGAEFTPSQLADFRRVTGEEPLAVRVAHASVDLRALSGPLFSPRNMGSPGFRAKGQTERYSLIAALAAGSTGTIRVLPPLPVMTSGSSSDWRSVSPTASEMRSPQP